MKMIPTKHRVPVLISDQQRHAINGLETRRKVMAPTGSVQLKAGLIVSRELVLSVHSTDCRWEYFPAGKNGGQKGNKTASACRVTHEPSGAKGESREQTSQFQNRRTAWRRMVNSPAFKVWYTRKLASGPSVEERAAKDMKPQNLRVEVRQDGKWVEAAL